MNRYARCSACGGRIVYATNRCEHCQRGDNIWTRLATRRGHWDADARLVSWLMGAIGALGIALVVYGIAVL